jgi:hypothetical protein
LWSDGVVGSWLCGPIMRHVDMSLCIIRIHMYRLILSLQSVPQYLCHKPGPIMLVHTCFNAKDLEKQPAAINISPSGIRPKPMKTTRTAAYVAVARTISFFLFNLWWCAGGGIIIQRLCFNSVLYLYCKCPHFKGPGENKLEPEHNRRLITSVPT